MKTMNDLEWINKVVDLNKSSNKNFELEEAADLIFEKIGDLLDDEKYHEVDKILLKFPLNHLSTELLICILSITLSQYNFLENRKLIFEQINEIVKIRDPENAEELMKGLKTWKCLNIR